MDDPTSRTDSGPHRRLDSCQRGPRLRGWRDFGVIQRAAAGAPGVRHRDHRAHRRELHNRGRRRRVRDPRCGEWRQRDRPARQAGRGRPDRLRQRLLPEFHRPACRRLPVVRRAAVNAGCRSRARNQGQGLGPAISRPGRRAGAPVLADDRRGWWAGRALYRVECHGVLREPSGSRGTGVRGVAARRDRCSLRR